MSVACHTLAGMPTERFAETDPDEIEYSKYVVKLLKRVDKISAELDKHVIAPPGSKLALDDARTPHYPVSDYSYGQLVAALGCLESLKQMIIREDEKSIEVVAGPYGSYALVRNALDCAATALWLLEPQSSTLRVKRRIMVQVDEIRNGAAARQSSGEPKKAWSEWKKKYRQRMREVAQTANLGSWNPLHEDEELPSMTKMLGQIERHHQNVVLPWLTAWQMGSGHAHGKQWVQVASHQLDEIANTRTDVGATFRVSIRYMMLAYVLLEAVQLIESAGARYLELLRP